MPPWLFKISGTSYKEGNDEKTADSLIFNHKRNYALCRGTVDYKYRILDTYTQIYREKYNSLEIYRLLSSEVPVEEALQITVTDGVYTDEEKELFLKRSAITEIDFLKDGNIYKYIASIEYGAVYGTYQGFVYNYENIMYRAKNAEDVGVFITEDVYVYFDARDNNEFMFDRYKNQMIGNIGWCTYYESVKDLT